MFKEIVVQVAPEETTVAVLEEQKLMEIYLERFESQRLVGNIYQGRVVNVLPGMQAAFVDIGLDKNAFLYVEDAYPDKEMSGEEGHSNKTPKIEDLLKEGQVLMVQVTKEPLGTKGARVTANITLPGRFLVLMPTLNYIGISRRIEAEPERVRLRQIVEELSTNGMGVIVRTAAIGAEPCELAEDFCHLAKTWKLIQSKKGIAPPAIIHQDLGLLERILRDVLTEDVNKLVINSKEEYFKIMEFAKLVAPYLQGKVVLKDAANLLGEYNIPVQIEQALKRKVWLECGGYLVIDEVEALTVIDVNTGKYIGSKNLAETVLKTNVDAALEIARQLRLRNIGGIIIIDFIDMEEIIHQQKVLDTLEQELKKDKTKTNVLGITQLGLVQLTRKKVSRDLGSILQKDCPYCQGTGSVLSEEAVSLKAKQEIIKVAACATAPIILVEAHPAVAALLIGSKGRFLRQLEKETGKKIVIRGITLLHIEEVKVSKVHQEDQLKEHFCPLKVGEIHKVRIADISRDKSHDGIANVDGVLINITQGETFLGQEVLVEITNINETKAKGRIISIEH